MKTVLIVGITIIGYIVPEWMCKAGRTVPLGQNIVTAIAFALVSSAIVFW